MPSAFEATAMFPDTIHTSEAQLSWSRVVVVSERELCLRCLAFNMKRYENIHHVETPTIIFLMATAVNYLRHSIHPREGEQGTASVLT